jgi:hypothetical protein
MIFEQAGDPPIDAAVPGVHVGAACLGDRGVKKIGADRGRRVDAEQQHQQGSHQGAAADSRETHDSAHGKSGQRLGWIDHVVLGWRTAVSRATTGLALKGMFS